MKTSLSCSGLGKRTLSCDKEHDKMRPAFPVLASERGHFPEPVLAPPNEHAGASRWLILPMINDGDAPSKGAKNFYTF